jgi:hypothetical protein
VSFAPVGRSPGRLYVAWSHRHQPVCAHASSHIGGIAHGAPGVNPYGEVSSIKAAVREISG